MSKIDTDDFEQKDSWEKERMKAAGEYRWQRLRQRQEEREYDELDDGEQEEEEFEGQQ